MDPIQDPSLDNQANPVNDQTDQMDNPAEEVSEGDKQEPHPELPEEVKAGFSKLLFMARDEDRPVRYTQLRLWRRLEYYWNNILDIFLDQNSLEWRVPDWDQLANDGETPPRLINIFRPLGEAVVAALSVTIPPILYHPDDPDNPDDIETAKAYRAINGLVSSHDDDSMLFIRALMIMFNQGTVFAYNYYHEDPKYGTIAKPKVELKDIEIFNVVCPQCGAPLDAGATGDGTNIQQSYACVDCGYQGPGEVENSTQSLPQITGWDKSAKGTIKRDIFSGLNVKVPAYVKDQDSCGYVLLEFAQSVAMLRKTFKGINVNIEHRADNTFENFSKLPIYYQGMQPDNAANVSCLWLRPWQFYYLTEDLAEQLEKLYPDGCYALFINDDFVEAYAENMDDHWTISDNPMGSYIYARPLGENLATIQDIRATLVEIELQTAEYGIPEMFVDERVLDLKKYGTGRASPGMVTGVRPRAGKSIGDAFYTTKSAVLSQEIDPLRQHIDADAQLSCSAFPSIYGGQNINGGKTASEYTQSRAMALQRLNITWKIMCWFWCKLQSRSATEYANVIKAYNQDVNYSKKVGTGFVNEWIKQSSLNGKIGRAEPEASEQLPQSWAQKRDVIMQLLQIQNPEISQVLTNPNNASFMKQTVGLEDLYIPGEEDRVRQHKEFQLLAQGVQVPTSPQIDNEEIHIEVLKSILEGPLGESLSEEGQNACLQHLQMHEQSVQSKMMPQQAGPNAGNVNGGKPPVNNSGSAPAGPMENMNG